MDKYHLKGHFQMNCHRERSAGEMELYVVLYSLPFILAIGGIVWWGFCLYRRSRSSLSEYLRPVLDTLGFELISSRVAAQGETGPFPSPGFTTSHMGATFVEDSWQFRRVTFRDKRGQKHETWARLFFGGDTPEVEWMPRLEDITREAEQTSRP